MDAGKAKGRAGKAKGRAGKDESGGLQATAKRFGRWAWGKARRIAPFALVGSIIGVVVFWEDHHESFDAGHAFIDSKVTTKRGFPLYVSLTNSGSQPVVVDSAILDVPRAKGNVKVRFYVADPKVVNQHHLDPGGVSAARQTLPITVDPHSAQTVVLLADPDTLNVGARKPERVYRAEQRAFCDFISEEESQSKAELTLNLEWKYGLVLSGEFPFLKAPETEETEVIVAGQKLTQPSWSARLSGPPIAPKAILFKRLLAEADVAELATMSVYGKSSSGPIYELERPLVGNSPTAFRLPRLERGTHLVAFSVGGDVVLTSRLPIPAPSRDHDLSSRARGFCAFLNGLDESEARPGERVSQGG